MRARLHLLLGIALLGTTPLGGAWARADIASIELPGPPALAQHEESVRRLLEEEYAKAKSLQGSAVPAEFARQCGRLGMIYERYRLTERALAFYRIAADLLPGDRRWAYHLGRLHHHRGEFDRAVEHFTRSLSIVDDIPTRHWLADCERGRGELAAASAHYRRILELVAKGEGAQLDPPPEARAHYGLGLVHMEEGNYAEAAARLRRALELRPSGTEARYPLGRCLRKLGQEDEARELMKARGTGAIVSGDPLTRQVAEIVEEESARVLQTEGTRQFQAGNHGKAAELFAEAAQKARAPDLKGSSLLNLATARVILAQSPGLTASQREQRLADARSSCLEALELGADRARTLFTLGRIEDLRGQDRRAIDAYRRSLEAREDQFGAHSNLGDLYRRAGEFGDALRHYERAVVLSPGDESARVAVALILIRLHRYDAAFTSLEASLAIYPDSPKLKPIMARLSAAAPRSPADLERARRYVDTHPGDLQALFVRIILGTQTGEWDATGRLVDRILEALGDTSPGTVELLRGYRGLIAERKKITAPWPDDHPTLSPGRRQ